MIPASASEVSQNQQVLDILSNYSLNPEDVGFFVQFRNGSDDFTYVFLYEDLPSPFAFEWRTYSEGGTQGFRLYPTNVKWYRVKNGTFATASTAVSFNRSTFSNLEAVDASSSITVYDGNLDPYFFFQSQERLSLLQILPQTSSVLSKILQILTLLVPSGLAIASLIVSVILLRRFSRRFA